MSISPVASPSAPAVQPTGGVSEATKRPKTPAAGTRTFSLVPDGAPAAAPPRAEQPSAVLRLFENIEGRRARIDRVINRAVRGADFSPTELLALQARVFAYNQEVELVARALDKTVGAAKTALNTQV